MADEKVTDWSIVASNNGPLGSQPIGTTLDDQLRAIKAIVRQESLDKQWEPWGLECSFQASLAFRIKRPNTSSSWIAPNGPVVVGRKVKILHDGNPPFFGSIKTATDLTIDNIPYTVCEVTPEFSGTLFSDIKEVLFGSLTPTSNALPNTIRTTQSNPFYSSSIDLTSLTDTTWLFNATFPNLGSGHPRSGEIYYVQFDWNGNSAFNSGPIWLGINNSSQYEIYRFNLNAYGAVPATGLTALRAGDVSRRQTLALMFDTSVTPYRWQMLNPSASVPTFLEIADLFSVSDSTVNGSVNKDTTNCAWQGFLTVFKNYVIQWALVNAIPASGNRIVTLPKSNISELLAISVTPVDVASANPLYVNRVSNTQIQIYNINVNYAVPCYAIVIARVAA